MYSGHMTHTAWPTADEKFLAVARESRAGDLGLWDIRDPSAPRKVWRIAVPPTQAWCVHQVVVQGNILYASWYQNGVSVFDISKPRQPVLLGSYDTYSGNIDVSFPYQGAWGIYPYPGDPSQLLVFDMYTGIYILRIDSTIPSPKRLREVSPGDFLLEPDPQAAAPGRTKLRDVHGGPAQLIGGVLRVTLADDGQTAAISRNLRAGTIEVTFEGEESQVFPFADVMQVNVFGGAGDDSIMLDPNLALPVYVDGAGGFNSATGWPRPVSTSSHSGARKVNGVFIHGRKGSPGRAERVQLLQFANAVPAATAHGLHVAGTSSVSHLRGNGPMSAGLSQTQSGVPTHVMFSGGALTAMSAGHAGGVIAPELMARTSTNNEVGGQVAYHKPG
jgi:hypothetical protein